MLSKKRQANKGDTLIEVLFAVTVFSLIVVGSLSIMNQGLAAAQRSLEITQVRQEIDGQAETLRFLHDSYVSVYQSGVTSAGLTGPARQWALIMEQSSVANAQPFDTNLAVCPSAPNRSFVVDPTKATYQSLSTIYKTPLTASMLEYNASGALIASQGLWVEAVPSAVSSDTAQQTAGYVDFHIRACWDTTGSSRPMNLGTIVRLYVPRG
jgi:type II secretory pathway pseudopilin PulG